jgi:hypothetical protein
MEALRLDTEPEQSPAAAGDVRTRIKALLDSDTVTQAEIAKKAGISSGAVSRWVAGKYEGDNAAVEKSLQIYLVSRERQSDFLLPEFPTYVPTRISERILTALTYGHMAADLVLVYGKPGVGKTVALNHYAGKRNNVWVVRASPSTANAGGILEEIALALGLKGSDISGRAARMQRRIVFQVLGTQGLLIIDEAQHLKLAALETLRAIHDQANIGLVLCGNEDVYSRLNGGARTAVFAQLFSRIGKRVSLTKAYDADVEALAAACKIAEPAALKLLKDIAQTPGAYRGVTKTLKLAIMLARGQTATLTVEHLKLAWRELGGVA